MVVWVTLTQACLNHRFWILSKYFYEHILDLRSFFDPPRKPLRVYREKAIIQDQMRQQKTARIATGAFAESN